MSIDVTARRAADAARRAASDVDTDGAIANVLGPRRVASRRRTVVTAIAVATAVVAALFLLIPDGAGLNGQQAPPAGPGTGPVGSRMVIPGAVTVPDGWTVEHDGGFVVLTTTHEGPNARIFIGVPTARYDEVDRSVSEPDGPWLTWLRKQRYLDAVTVGHPQVDGVEATTVELYPADGQRDRFHTQTALATGTDDTASETLFFVARSWATSWTIVPTPEGEVVVTLTAQSRAGPAGFLALDAVLGSLDFGPSAP